MQLGNAESNGGAGTSQPIESFIEDAKALDPIAFAERHGQGFLLLTAELSRPRDTTNTALQLISEEDAGERTGGLSTVVFPIRSGDHIATVGRSSENDVVIPDSSVSRSHALMKQRDGGAFMILDAGSSNGTIVNGQNVLVRGHGPATPLKAGDNVRIGAVDFTFVDAPHFRDYAAMME